MTISVYHGVLWHFWRRRILSQKFISKLEPEVAEESRHGQFGDFLYEGFSNTDTLSSKERREGEGVPLPARGGIVPFTIAVKALGDELFGLLPLAGVILHTAHIDHYRVSLTNVQLTSLNSLIHANG